MRRVLLSLLCLLVFGCEDLSDFKTEGSEVFRGEVVGSDSTLGTGSFIREGFASHTLMELTFDPDLAGMSPEDEEGEQAKAPGKLTTYVCPGGKDTCKKAGRDVQHFDAAALKPIARLAHDSLSEYSFPGGGRIRNYIFGARFSSAATTGPVARHAMVFVSLMENGEIEVRVIAPSALDADGKTELLPALFGVFVLGRQGT